MTNYQVIRPFSGYEVGATLSAADFASPGRIAYLVSHRYLKATQQSENNQPTVAALNNATIRQLSSLLPAVVDRCVLEAALGKETREAAIKAMNKRLSEMETTDEHTN